jgi:tRNA (guanine26-N2/guanine27-N2)-dimethyltransferase
MHVREGGVEIEIPGESTEGVEESVFYNPEQELNRDLTIAVLDAYRDREPRADTYLDAMTASGIRGVRAASNGWSVSCADLDDEAVALCERNLERNHCSGTVQQRDANALMYDEYFDVIDIDPYGSPIPFADAALSNARDLVCVTATDTAPLCGAHFDAGVRRYGAVPRNTDYHAEMGVRILLGALVRTAARYDVAAVPILTHATRHYVRTYLDLEDSASAANDAIDQLGSIHHCQDCLFRQPEWGLILDPPAQCPSCESQRLRTAGPLWLDSYRDPAFVTAVREAIDDEMGTADYARELCETLWAELDRPTHYDHHRLCKQWGRPASAMDEFLDALRAAGFSASPAQYGGTTFKTDASVEQIREATVDLVP